MGCWPAAGLRVFVLWLSLGCRAAVLTLGVVREAATSPGAPTWPSLADRVYALPQSCVADHMCARCAHCRSMLRGKMEHADSMGNKGVIGDGELALPSYVVLCHVLKCAGFNGCGLLVPAVPCAEMCALPACRTTPRHSMHAVPCPPLFNPACLASPAASVQWMAALCGSMLTAADAPTTCSAPARF